jgi:hypothetical protein
MRTGLLAFWAANTGADTFASHVRVGRLRQRHDAALPELALDALNCLLHDLCLWCAAVGRDVKAWRRLEAPVRLKQEARLVRPRALRASCRRLPSHRLLVLEVQRLRPSA